MTKLQVVVVGGGAAGMIAARCAAENGSHVVLLEKNVSPGLKILISGGGKCNLTHAGSMEEVRAKFRPNEARFLKPSFYRYSNEDFLNVLHRHGMQTYTRPDGRIFPVEPSNARDVVALLTGWVRQSGVELRTNAPCDGIVVKGDRSLGVIVDGKTIVADRVIVSTGGSSYPGTGTTGDGWRWLEDAGHTIEPLRAALAPLYLQDARPDWSGVALRDIVLRARAGTGGRQIACWPGDLLFTHKGLSGPCALGISREIAEYMAGSSDQCSIGTEARNSGRAAAAIEVDLCPGSDYELIRDAARRMIQDSPRKTVAGLAGEYVPERLVAGLVESIAAPGDTRLAHLSARGINCFATMVKGWPLGTVRSVPLERGEVVAGGVRLDEVNPQTMESRRIPGLYLCGEVLDIAGPVGGYNLQAAWSTGYVAGASASIP